ncbi:MAG: hypothetical protein J7L04_13095 [Bacteroidales bacterium]|nr:hypothetical protein [Bacteroidales bacterium]
MENQINIATRRLAISFADDVDIPARYKSKSNKQKKINPDSSVEIRFQNEVAQWNILIKNMLDKLDKSIAWKFINISPNPQTVSNTVAYNKDFSDFIDYLVKRRDKENCDAEELGRLTMLLGAFQKELEKHMTQ